MSENIPLEKYQKTYQDILCQDSRIDQFHSLSEYPCRCTLCSGHCDFLTRGANLKYIILFIKGLNTHRFMRYIVSKGRKHGSFSFIDHSRCLVRRVHTILHNELFFFFSNSFFNCFQFFKIR